MSCLSDQLEGLSITVDFAQDLGGSKEAWSLQGPVLIPKYSCLCQHTDTHI